MLIFLLIIKSNILFYQSPKYEIISLTFKNNAKRLLTIDFN
jgi:hypothetical protein